LPKITYHVPATPENQAQLLTTVKRLFPGAAPTITQRATGTTGVDWEHLDTLADLLDAKPTLSPFVTFTLNVDHVEHTPEQQDFLGRQIGTDQHTEYTPEELLKQIQREENNK
jgi:hypothetical protein